MSWIVAGLIAGVVAYLVDYVMWGKVFTRGMDALATPPPAGQPVNMGPMLIKAASLAILYGVIFAYFYGQFRHSLWVPPGPLAGMELATVFWVPLALCSIGSGVWYDRARPLLMAQLWSWLARMNAVGIVVGLLMK